MSLRSCLLRSVTFALLSIAELFAQQPKVLAPHKPVLPFAPKPWTLHKPPVPRSMIGGLWMTDANFKSTIYLKNYVEIYPITVTPVLYLSNGKSYTLPDVTLEPAGTATVNINDALRQQGIAPWATLSGYVEIKYQWPWDALCVMVRDVDVVHSLIFTYFLRSLPATLTAAAPNTAVESHYAEGMWWKQESDVSGFLALSNPTTKPVQAQIQISDDQANVLGEHTITVSPHGTKLWNIPELQSAKSSEGGIRVSYSGPEFSLLITGGLEDQTVGYSANIPFTSSPPAALDSKPLTYAELGLMTGAADPMLSFPAGTTFTPYSLVHNVSDWPISVTPSLYWMQAGTPRSFRSTAFTLAPHQTASIDVASLLVQSGLKDFNGSFNLILDVPGNSRGLLMASGSVDRSNTYVFEVLPKGIGETMAQGFSYWSIANGDDTMVTLWNPADEAQDFIVNFFFSGGHYEYPIHLGPRVTLTFNVSEIVHNQLPDREGNVIPPQYTRAAPRFREARESTNKSCSPARQPPTTYKRPPAEASVSNARKPLWTLFSGSIHSAYPSAAKLSLPVLKRLPAAINSVALTGPPGAAATKRSQQ